MNPPWRTEALPTSRTLVAVHAQGPRTWALASNVTSNELSEAGTEVWWAEGTSGFQVQAHFPGLALRTLQGFPDGRFVAAGVGGTALHFDGQNPVTRPLPSKNAVWQLWGKDADDVYAVGEGAFLHFDGQRWQGLGLTDSTQVAVDGTDESLWVCGNGLSGPFLWGKRAGKVETWPLPSFAAYALHARADGSAWVLTSDGVFEGAMSAAPRRLVDFRNAPLKPFGPPAAVSEWQDQPVVASVDGVSVMKALFTEKESLGAQALNLFWAGRVSRLVLSDPEEITSVAFLDERVCVGARGRLFEAPLSQLFD